LETSFLRLPFPSATSASSVTAQGTAFRMLREPLVELAETSVYQVSFGCRSLRQLRQAQLPRRERSRSLVELAETSVYQVPFGCRSLRLPFPSAAVPFGCRSLRQLRQAQLPRRERGQMPVLP